nr:hypothetical protein CFP56_55020 [Quercus suber]
MLNKLVGDGHDGSATGMQCNTVAPLPRRSASRDVFYLLTGWLDRPEKAGSRHELRCLWPRLLENGEYRGPIMTMNIWSETPIFQGFYRIMPIGPHVSRIKGWEEEPVRSRSPDRLRVLPWPMSSVSGAILNLRGRRTASQASPNGCNHGDRGRDGCSCLTLMRCAGRRSAAEPPHYRLVFVWPAWLEAGRHRPAATPDDGNARARPCRPAVQHLCRTEGCVVQKFHGHGVATHIPPTRLDWVMRETFRVMLPISGFNAQGLHVRLAFLASRDSIERTVLYCTAPHREYGTSAPHPTVADQDYHVRCPLPNGLSPTALIRSRDRTKTLGFHCSPACVFHGRLGDQVCESEPSLPACTVDYFLFAGVSWHARACELAPASLATTRSRYGRAECGGRLSRSGTNVVAI